MSYYCCKRITLDKKNNKIKVCVASSNVFPKDYGTYELCESNSKYYKNYSFEDKLISLYQDIQSGNIQITSLNDNTEKFAYAMRKVREWLRENNIDSYEDLYKKRGSLAKKKRYKLANIVESNNEDLYDRERENENNYKKWAETQDKDYVTEKESEITLQATWEVYGKAYEVWKKALEENFDGEYIVKFSKNYVVTKLGKYDRGYNKFSYSSYEYGAMRLSYKKAYIVKYDMGDNRNLEIVKV